MPTIPVEQQYLKNTLAASATFQTWVGAADATEAAERIHCFMLPDPEPNKVDPENPDEYPREQLEALRPFALIFVPDDEKERREMVAVGSGPEFSHSGRLHIRFEQNTPDGLNGLNREAHQAFYVMLRDGVLKDMDALPRGAGLYLAYTSGEIQQPHWESPEAVSGKGLYQMMIGEFIWGAT